MGTGLRGRAFASVAGTHKKTEGAVSTRNSDDGTIDRWRLEPRFKAFEIDDPPDLDHAPTLWKDLTLAVVVAAVLWITAVALFG
jgi:hypothetical protein